MFRRFPFRSALSFACRMEEKPRRCPESASFAVGLVSGLRLGWLGLFDGVFDVRY